jgi:hypothetical protein
MSEAPAHEDVTIVSIYDEILNLRKKIDRIESILIPEEEIRREELAELKSRRKEVLKGKHITLEALLAGRR